MKKLNNHIALYATAALTVMASCVRESIIDEPRSIGKEEFITFFTNTIDTDNNSAAKNPPADTLGQFFNGACLYRKQSMMHRMPTKGQAIIHNSDLNDDIHLTAYMISEENDYSDFIFGAQATKRENNGSSWYATVNKYPLPNLDGSTLKYIAITPYEFVNGSVVKDEGYLYIDYTTPTDVSEQKDLMIGYSPQYTQMTIHPTLTMNHILSGIRFKMSGFFPDVTVSRISISGIYQTGTYEYDVEAQTGVWENYSGKQTYTVSTNTNYTYGSEGILNDNAHSGELFVLPQVCPAGSKLTIIGTTSDRIKYEKEYSLDGFELAEGVINEFNISIPSLFYIHVPNITVNTSEYEPTEPISFSKTYTTNIPNNPSPSDRDKFEISVIQDVSEIMTINGAPDNSIDVSVNYYNFTAESWNSTYYAQSEVATSNAGIINIMPNYMAGELSISGPEYIFVGTSDNMVDHVYATTSGYDLPIPSRYMTWTSSNSCIQVDEYGNLIGISNGVADISANLKFPRQIIGTRTLYYNQTKSLSGVMCISPMLTIGGRTLTPTYPATPIQSLTSLRSTTTPAVYTTTTTVADNEWLVSPMRVGLSPITQTISFYMATSGYIILELNSDNNGTTALAVSTIGNNSTTPGSETATQIIGRDNCFKTNYLVYSCTAGNHCIKITAEGSQPQIHSKIAKLAPDNGDIRSLNTYTVISRDTWEIVECPSWIKASTTSGGVISTEMTPTSVVIVAENNTTGLRREGVITFHTTDGSDLTKSINVSQLGFMKIDFTDPVDDGYITIEF